MIKNQLVIQMDFHFKNKTNRQLIKFKEKIKLNGGLMETEVDLKNGITSKNLEDSARMQMIFIIKQDIP